MEKELHKIVISRALLIGFFGGFIWGTLYLIMYLFNMVEVDHIQLLNKWFDGEKWVSKWYAHIIFLFLLSIVSIILALLYYFILRKRKSWVVGAIYGLSIWLVLYYILPVLTTGFNPFIQYEMETHIGMVCVFILYGVFVGYSISYDYDHMKQELAHNDQEGEEEGEFQI